MQIRLGEESLRLLKHILELEQLEVVLLQGHVVGVHIREISLQVGQLALQLVHFTRRGGRGIGVVVACLVQDEIKSHSLENERWKLALTQFIDGNVVPHGLPLEVPELALHLLAPLDLVDELPLEPRDVGVEVDELHEPQLAQLVDAVVGRLALQDQLTAGDGLRAEEHAAPLRGRQPRHGALVEQEAADGVDEAAPEPVGGCVVRRRPRRGVGAWKTVRSRWVSGISVGDWRGGLGFTEICQLHSETLTYVTKERNHYYFSINRYGKPQIGTGPIRPLYRKSVSSRIYVISSLTLVHNDKTKPQLKHEDAPTQGYLRNTCSDSKSRCL